MTDSRLYIENLDKSWAAPVLRGVSLAIAKGEVHAIVGENGAGKTTLVNILAGLTGLDGGRISLDGDHYQPAGAADAFAAGVSVASQELATIGTLSIAENVALRSLPATRGVVDRAALAALASEALHAVGFDGGDIDRPADTLAVADRQLVELARAFAGNARLLVLDEPTAALGAPQAGRLHELTRQRAARGTAVIYISHRLGDVLAVADRVSVLRDGRLVLTAAANSLTVDDLVTAMAGDIFRRHAAPGRPARPGPALIEVDAMTTADLPTPVSLTGRAGEIIGIAGLAGAGRSELLHAIFGLVRLTGGRVLRHNDGRTVAIDSARRAVHEGVALLGEDRQSMGIFSGLSVQANMMMSGTASSPARRIDQRGEKAAAATIRDKLGIRCRNLDQDIAELSGGNQQKALIGRWLVRDSDVLLLDEPTRGVDVATKAAIYDLLYELAGNGKCIVLASSEIEELTTVCSRILVLSGRKLVREFVRGEWSGKDILSAAFKTYTGRIH